ncbi:MAG: thiamine phosphate synthase [Dehalococcoidia bacterium]|nr:thiamine phosphate synthase [Dehalococcoidia bacterium]
MPALSLPCLCLVTRREPWGEDALVQKVAAAVEGGVTVVQLREKDIPGGQLLALAHRLRQVTSGRALLVVNERVDVALACGADGIELGEEALPVAEARKLVGKGVLIGRSVHSVEGAVAAAREGADFLVVGTIFPTASKPGAETAGLALLRQVGKAVRIPYLAIGGVDESNAAQVIEAGAAGAAVIGAILEAPDPKAAAARLKEAMQKAWAKRAKVGVARR